MLEIIQFSQLCPFPMFTQHRYICTHFVQKADAVYHQASPLYQCLNHDTDCNEENKISTWITESTDITLIWANYLISVRPVSH